MKTVYLHKFINSFFKDKTGRIVIWQAPNIPIYGWAIFKTLSLAISQPNLQKGLEQTSSAFLFIWAYLEFVQGVNYFRRTLGLLLLGLLIFNFFND
jgi:hypothetical protein